ncbi:jumonji family transcription factor [Ceratobasidium theobromae]|uniref:[histone H3]-trimethyl-L-lysine(9) demethylase n=1 Tax=Ceratobasidium theobromae TaxID=1582974 RepID=A0A5N5QF07_9AGAM|nr:jumonji family transcription factor [Ceratobasidium theobromae]
MAFSSTSPFPSHLDTGISRTFHSYSPISSRESTPELTPEQERARRRAIVQPAFFYPNTGAFDPSDDVAEPSKRTDADVDEDALADELLDPAEDPRATRGIPVFRPTMEEFADFEKYMEKVELWGRRSGIVKIIPPQEWRDGLSSTASRLSGVKLRNPIEQHMIGRTGLYRQQNEERRHTYSVRDWAALCARDGLRAPRPRDIIQHELNARRSRRARKGEDTVEDDQERAALSEALRKIDQRGHQSSHSAHIQRTDSEFYNSLNPLAEWLPDNTLPEDYTPAVCRALERHYWRNCGFGKDPMYGADMQGTLFDPDMKTWNVACLPNLLERLLPTGNKIPGVNTPYLYFGMWRATFAWHVEDMDLYSINYIHWGAPKYWYAIPSQRADAFEDVMRKHFPTEASECPQFMRHKSFLASPAILAEADCRPNTLVQHQGEFVITYPRGYHAGFNVGFNCAESVNFALESWIELGRRAQFCKCVGDSVHLDVDAILTEREARNSFDLALDDYSHLVKKRKASPSESLAAKRPRTQEPGEAHSAAEPEHLPPIKIRIKPLKIQPQNTSPYRARTQAIDPDLPKLANPLVLRAASHPMTNESHSAPRSANVRTFQAPKSPSGSSSSPLPRLKITAQPPPLPCNLCSSTDLEGLLPVRGLSSAGGESASPRRASAAIQTLESLRAHEFCAQAVPETWVTEMGGQKYVCGVDKVVKDRWTLKCSLCLKSTSRLHGAKIQCAKGRCPKAFHVGCAKDSSDVELTVAEGGEDSSTTGESSEGKRLKKPTVTVLCPQHNPRLVEARKADKQQKLDADIGALTQYSRIKVRASGGVFAVTLVNVYEDRRTVEVMWDQGSTKEFRYTSVVWTDDGEVQEKPGKGMEGSSTVAAGNATVDSGSNPAPAPTQPSSHDGSDPPLNASKPSLAVIEKSERHSKLPKAGPAGYSFHPYPYYYPPSYPQAISTDGASQPQPQANPPRPPSHHAYTVPMPVPVQYPYTYTGYNQQHGFSSQPQFYPAHGYHYPPITTYHPAAPTPPANTQPTSTPGTASSHREESKARTSASTANSAASNTPSAGGSVRSYVGVRPASSQDILNGVHQARGLSRT